jgi:predicted amidohydrolase
VKIGFVQLAPVLGDVHATMKKLGRLIPPVGEADLVVLPELCNSGYNFASAEQAWALSEEIGRSVFVEYLETLCQRHSFFVVSGFNERAGGRLHNSAILVGPDGYVGKYRKLHLFVNEKDYFEPGDAGLPVFDIGPARVGMLVCFDWRFPEVWRILALQGADVICHPSNLVTAGAPRTVPVHALLNRTYVVMANRIGVEGDLTFTGLSTIADPGGNVLVQASSSDEEIGLVDVAVELARDKRVTSRNDAFADRRPELYGLLSATG